MLYSIIMQFKKLLSSLLLVPLAFFIILTPSIASAHEVYVLSTNETHEALAQPPLQAFSIIAEQSGLFFFGALLAITLVIFVFVISISRKLEHALDPKLIAIKKYAPFVARITLGLSILSAGYFDAVFGPELPFKNFLDPTYFPIFSLFLYITGFLILIGLWTRISAFLLILMFMYFVYLYGTYMFTYTNYFGEMMLAFILGANFLSVDRTLPTHLTGYFRNVTEWLENHAFLILRVSFGISLIFASVYAKFLHADLALKTVADFQLTNFFPFEAHFLVLGAFIIEVLLGVFFIIGFEIRFAAIFLLAFLTMSLLYFGEAVWPHIILAGVAIAIFLRGYGPHTLEWRILRRFGRDEEPVL